jgi:hypothetical protein
LPAGGLAKGRRRSGGREDPRSRVQDDRRSRARVSDEAREGQKKFVGRRRAAAEQGRVAPWRHVPMKQITRTEVVALLDTIADPADLNAHQTSVHMHRPLSKMFNFASRGTTASNTTRAGHRTTGAEWPTSAIAMLATPRRNASNAVAIPSRSQSGRQDNPNRVDGRLSSVDTPLWKRYPNINRARTRAGAGSEGLVLALHESGPDRSSRPVTHPFARSAFGSARCQTACARQSGISANVHTDPPVGTLSCV